MKPKRDEALRIRSAEGARELAAWAAGAARQPLPPEIRDRAALVLADNIGAMVIAATEPGVARTREVFARTSSAAEASVFAPGTPRLDRASAASANGMAAAWCELDEGYRGAPCHAGAYVLPALLAEAEARGATLGAVLACLAVGYEITARMARAFPFPSMTVHPHAAFATIGAAAGVSLIRGQDGQTLLDAVSGAASMTFAGPYEHAIDGALVRNAWTSAGAWIGIRSADFAEAGIAGIPETFYDVFATAFGTGTQPDLLTAGLGTEWAIAGGYHKIFACCQYAHAAIEATLELRGRLDPGRGIDDLEEILVETHPRGLTLTAVEPPTVLSAKFSMPHAMAASAVAGTGGQPAFSEEALHDPRIAALRRKVRLEPLAAIGPPPNDRPSRVTWRFRDGETWSELRESARGGADQPFDEPTLLAKLADNTGAAFPAMAGVLAAIVRGETDPGIRWRDTVDEMMRDARRP